MRFAKSQSDLCEDVIDLLVCDFHLRQSRFRRSACEALGRFYYQRFSPLSQLLDLSVDVRD